MIAKSTASLLVNGIVAINGGSVSSPWLDIRKKVAATTRVKTELLTTTQDRFIEVRVELADDGLGTNIVPVFIGAAEKLKSPVVSYLSHRHRITDRFVRVTVKNPGTIVGGEVTVNAQADLVDNIG